ncbi:MAG: sulfatase [Puniceicoccaceae bacterium]
MNGWHNSVLARRKPALLGRLQVLLLCAFLSCSVVADSRPNLIFIMMDDLGYGQCAFNNDELTIEDFDPYFSQLVAERQGYPPEQALEFSLQAMPTLSLLAHQGIVFNRAYAPSSLCAPSRLSIATARNQHARGIYTNVDVETVGFESGTLLATHLQDAGYATAHIGKWHMSPRDEDVVRTVLARHGIEMDEDTSWQDIHRDYRELSDEVWESGYYGSVVPEQNPVRNGFDYYYGYNYWASQFYNSPLVWENERHAGRQAGYNTDVFTDKALEFIKKQVTEDKPFFVQLHYHAVHDYLQPNAPRKYFRKFPSHYYDLSNFYAHVYGVDYNIKRIIKYLEQQDALDNTLIVFTSDNGAMAGGPSVLPGNAPFSGQKGTYFQGGTRVPLLFHWPDGIMGGRVLDTLASSMDIMPTFLGAAGIGIPDGLDGKNLCSILSGKSSEEVRDHMLWAGIHARRWGFLINTSYKYHGTEWPFAPSAWAVLKGDFLLRFVGSVEPGVYHESPDGAAASLKLYNISDDPAETRELADKYPEKVQDMKALYLEYSECLQPPRRWSVEKWQELAGDVAEDAH